MKQNYFAKVIKVLKSFLNWATEKGYNTNREFEKFKAVEHDIDIVYLTFDELLKLYEKEFESDTLSHVRDFYCMVLYRIEVFRFVETAFSQYFGRSHCAFDTEDQNPKSRNQTKQIRKSHSGKI